MHDGVRQVSVNGSHVKPAQQVRAPAHEPPCPLHWPCGQTPLVHVPVQHCVVALHICPAGVQLVRQIGGFEVVSHVKPEQHAGMPGPHVEPCGVHDAA